MFGSQDEEEQDGGRRIEPDKYTSQLQQFGIIPYVITYLKLTNHTFTEALTHNINTVLYLVSYDYTIKKIEQEQLKKAYKK